MAHIKYEINFMDYLHEKAQDSRNKEIQACLMFILGTVFFMGGELEALMLAENPEWFIFIPYHTEPLGGAVLGLFLIMSGMSLMVYGIFAGIIIRADRKQYMEELRKVSSEGRELMRKKRAKKEHSRP